MMTTLINALHALNAWAHGLPMWGLACVMMLLAGVSKRIGLLVSIGSGIAVFALFGQLWGLFYIIAVFGPWIILLLVVLLLAIFAK